MRRPATGLAWPRQRGSKGGEHQQPHRAWPGKRPNGHQLDHQLRVRAVSLIAPLRQGTAVESTPSRVGFGSYLSRSRRRGEAAGRAGRHRAQERVIPLPLDAQRRTSAAVRPRSRRRAPELPACRPRVPFRTGRRRQRLGDRLGRRGDRRRTLPVPLLEAPSATQKRPDREVTRPAVRARWGTRT